MDSLFENAYSTRLYDTVIIIWEINQNFRNWWAMHGNLEYYLNLHNGNTHRIYYKNTQIISFLHLQEKLYYCYYNFINFLPSSQNIFQICLMTKIFNYVKLAFSIGEVQININQNSFVISCICWTGALKKFHSYYYYASIIEIYDCVINMISSIPLNNSTLEKFKLHRPSKSTSYLQRNIISTHHEHPHEIKVVSPFYEKNKCNAKGPCLCPFHRKKREKMVKLLKPKTMKSQNMPENKVKKMIRVNTQQLQKKILPFTAISKQNFQQVLKSLFSSEKQSYFNVLHKVQCRNSQYEQFLKKNQLYILTGKLSNGGKNKQDYATDQNFLQNFNKFFQTDAGVYQDNGYRRYNNKNKSFANGANSRDANKKQTRLPTKHYLGKVGEGSLIHKIREVIQSLICGTKKMNLVKMKKLRQLYLKLLSEQFQISGQDSAYTKNKQSLEKFDSFLQQYEQKTSGGGKNKHKNKNRQFFNSFSGYSYGVKAGISNDDKRSKTKKAILTQGQQIQSKFDQKNKDDKQQDQNNFQFYGNNEYIKDHQHQNQAVVQGKGLYSPNQNDEQFSNQQMRKNSSSLFSGIFNRNINKYSKKNNCVGLGQLSSFKSQNQDKRSKQQQKSDKQFQSFNSHDSGDSQHYFHQQKNLKQAKLKQIFNNMKDDSKNDKNYLKMKKYIQKNKKFIKKMEMKLLHLQLGMFVIEPTDSLITRKKKIRCMKEMLDSRQNCSDHKKGFYDQIMKYLDIYTEHCNMLMKKEVKKKKNDDVDCQFAYEDLPISIESKDLSNSLKFITLHQNQQFEKQKKLQGWISIPQYITKDHTRIKQSEKFQQSVKYIEGILKTEKFEESSSQSEDSLIQTPLENKCTIKKFDSFYEKYQLNARAKTNQDDTPELSNKFNFKIQAFKKRLLKDF